MIEGQTPPARSASRPWGSGHLGRCCDNEMGVSVSCVVLVVPDHLCLDYYHHRRVGVPHHTTTTSAGKHIFYPDKTKTINRPSARETDGRDAGMVDGVPHNMMRDQKRHSTRPVSCRLVPVT
jgi:hypothetical protein